MTMVLLCWQIADNSTHCQSSCGLDTLVDWMIRGVVNSRKFMMEKLE